MKIAILGTGFGKEHAGFFRREKLVDEEPFIFSMQQII